MPYPAVLASTWAWERDPVLAWAVSIGVVVVLVVSYFVRQRMGR